jgi:transcriptional regulator with XRE-family HTH domain/anti-sigma regulatory factor (Ser/Thr protein kinase)
MSEAEVVSLADRLKRRREELGLSQAQAARELDVARTAYRLWEMEAATPQPDRWRLISRWLGVSVTTMLLADELDSASRHGEDLVSSAFERVGRDWAEPIAEPVEFFGRARQLVQEGTERGFITAAHAQELLSVISGIEDERAGADSVPWEPVKLAKELTASTRAPRAAREAIAFVAGDLPTGIVQDAQLLASELVANSVVHGRTTKGTKVGLLVDIDRERIRVEVADGAAGAPALRPDAPGAGGYGLLLVENIASRWDTARVKNGNLTWFEIDLAQPGAQPNRH